MRLIAWNCCQKFAANYVHLRDLDFDIAVIAECSPIEPDALQVRPLTSGFVQPLPRSPKHLGVFAQDPWQVSPHPTVSSKPWLLPMVVSGPSRFTMLGFWGADPGRFGSYTAQLRQVIDEVLPAVEGDVVIAGDFNAPVASTLKAHTENVRRLEERHLISAFIATRSVEAPLEPTYYHGMHEDQPFHIDHVFVPEAWRAQLSLTVGGYDEWVASRRSDHVPLIMEVEVP